MEWLENGIPTYTVIRFGVHKEGVLGTSGTPNAALVGSIPTSSAMRYCTNTFYSKNPDKFITLIYTGKNAVKALGAVNAEYPDYLVASMNLV